MITEWRNPVTYALRVGEQEAPLNPLLGRALRLRYTGRIFCVHCGGKTKKSYNQGYCYPCFIKLAQCDRCITQPELCHYAAGTCREPEWGDKFCNQPHTVYLANSSGLKVGITRDSQIPTRWMDQGAAQALPILRAASRYISGLAEVALAKRVSDKTNWRQMLKQAPPALDLPALRDSLLGECAAELARIRAEHGEQSLIPAEAEPLEIVYPVLNYPDKLKSYDLEKTETVSGILHGVKGQYWLLDGGVINIRKYTGYEVEFHFE